MSRIYPRGGRVDSSNYLPQDIQSAFVDGVPYMKNKFKHRTSKIMKDGCGCTFCYSLVHLDPIFDLNGFVCYFIR
ncbi:hypothetical protein KUTeg_013421 [Tegillarca granosa]|uniref:PI-PLC Y-box domain-containing protein n=1 Tax=Tegillarca granosa TaxID=220873 RepID=A0ABQ9EY51_TEGGR|nr:hypothetical protein KUTeg_013421 [Tegillarca granosa]